MIRELIRRFRCSHDYVVTGMSDKYLPEAYYWATCSECGAIQEGRAEDIPEARFTFD